MSKIKKISVSNLKAVENDLQLLIERPDFDGGEIEYQIVQN